MSPETDEQELVRRILAGDRTAVEYFCHKYRPRFMLIAYRLGVPHSDTEDVAQNTLMDAIRQLSQFRWDSSLGHWLNRILRGHVVNRWRALPPPSISLTETRSEVGESDLQSVGIMPSSRATQELAAEVREVLKAMPPKLAILLKLNVWWGLSAREIAEKLGFPPKVVSRNLTKAKQVFKEISMGEGKSDENSRQNKSRPA